MPLARHSTLPELRRFVSLFKPRRVVPNTLDPALKGLDEACIDRMFAGCLADTSSSNCLSEAAPSEDLRDLDAAVRAGTEGEDVAFKNLEGEGARDVAEKWADSGRMRRKLAAMKRYLPTSLRRIVEQILGGSYHPCIMKIPEPVPLKRAGSRAVPRQPSSPPASTAQKPKPAFQGRATIEQSEAAMARLQRHSVPKALRSPEPDSDTDNDDDEKHERIAMFFFGDQIGTPAKPHSYAAMDADMTSSSMSPSPIVKGPSHLARLPSDMPFTPTSKRGSQDLSHWLQCSSSSPPPEDLRTPRRQTQTQGVSVADTTHSEKPRTPRRATTFGSPCELSTARKRKMISIPTPRTDIKRLLSPVKGKRRDKGVPIPSLPLLAPAAALLPHRVRPMEASPNSVKATAGSPPNGNPGPLVDLHNLRKRPQEHSDMGGDEDTSTDAKRRRLDGRTTDCPPALKDVTEALCSPHSRTVGADQSAPQAMSHFQRSTGRRTSGKEQRKVQVQSAKTDSVNVISSTSRIMDAIAVSVAATSRPIEVRTDPFPASSAAESPGAPPSCPKVYHPRLGSKAKSIGKDKDKNRQDARMERLTIAERLAKAVPAHFVSPSYTARKEREQRRGSVYVNGPGENASACASSSSSRPGLDGKPHVSSITTKSRRDDTATEAIRRDWKIPSKLPSQDEEMEQEAAARIAMQKEGFQRQLARGVRPGLFVPRLRCLESQE